MAKDEETRWSYPTRPGVPPSSNSETIVYISPAADPPTPTPSTSGMTRFLPRRDLWLQVFVVAISVVTLGLLAAIVLCVRSS